MKTTFTRKEISEKTGLQPRQIQFYTDAGVVGFEEGSGGTRGKARKYSEEHMKDFMIVKELADYGITYTKIKQILDNLKKTPGISDVKLILSPLHETYVLVKKAGGEIDDKFKFDIIDVAHKDHCILKPSDLKNADGYVVINYGRIIKRMRK